MNDAVDPAVWADNGTVAARRGDLVVIGFRYAEWYRGRRLPEYDDFRAGRVAAVTGEGRVRLYREAGGYPGRDRPLPAEGFRCALVASARRIDVRGALATAACHVLPGSAGLVRGYDSLEEVQAALRPHLLTQPRWGLLRDAARAREAALKAAQPLLFAAASAPREQFVSLFRAYDSAVAAANAAYRQIYEQATAQGDKR